MSWFSPKPCDCNCGDIIKPECNVLASMSAGNSGFPPVFGMNYSASRVNLGDLIDVEFSVNGVVEELYENEISVNGFYEPSFGDVLRLKVTVVGDSSCETIVECTWYGAAVTTPTCKVYDTTIEGYLDDNDDCIQGPADQNYLRDATSHQAVVSGLLGPMAPLNGTYTVDCNSKVSSASERWGSTVGEPSYGSIYSLNCGSVTLRWLGDNHAELTIGSSHATFDGGGLITCDILGWVAAVSTSQKSTKNPINASRSGVQRQTHSCDACAGDLTINWTTGNTTIATPPSGSPTGDCTDLGACAYPGVITWNY